MVAGDVMAEPLTVTQVAEFLRLDSTSSPIPEEDLITGIITAARIVAEKFTNRTIVERQRVLTLDYFTTVIDLPYGDVSSVDSIVYVDSDGNNQNVTDWILSENRATAAYNESWPSTRDQIGAVTITYTAGYTSIPEPIIQSIYLTIQQMYDVREGTSYGQDFKINPAVESLLTPYRINMGV